jgi:hypothetical protein
MALVRFDIVGGANERSVHLEVDGAKEVSSFKIDVDKGEAHVYYKRAGEADTAVVEGEVVTATATDTAPKKSNGSKVVSDSDENIAAEKRTEALTGAIKPADDGNVNVNLSVEGKAVETGTNVTDTDKPAKPSAAKTNTAKNGNVTDTVGK